MSAHTSTHPTKSDHGYVSITYDHKTYAIPKNIVELYPVSSKTVFAQLEKKLTKAGALLKGLRTREGLSQISFAKKIDVTQANLSKMENGHRPIGKIIAKRIEKIFGVNYRYFLE